MDKISAGLNGMARYRHIGLILRHMTGFAHDKVVPYEGSRKDKKEQVAEMFNDIAPRYDFMNRFLSAGIDIAWRRKALKTLKSLDPQEMLDVATGTADVAIMASKVLAPRKIIGIDISEGMLSFGRQKIERQGLSDVITLQTGDSERIEFPDDRFDAVTVAFGVRNFADLAKGIAEIHRVIRPGGKLVVLEFSRPHLPGVRGMYNLYMNHIAPRMGGIFSKNRAAYQYLNDSVQRFPEGKAFIQVLENAGFKQTLCKRLSLGICSIYTGVK
jgi:demethylmenaquinone methyltransferase/2-methoxy-6-polyprenyl-1,4-benzoquinol methylase